MTSAKAVAIIQARMGSSRLPGKVLVPLAGRHALARVCAAAAATPGIDAVIVATSDQTRDQAIADWCADNAVACHRGPAEDVLGRFLGAIEATGGDIVMRLTADCPLLDPEVCGQVLALLRLSGCDIASNASPPSWPDGLDCEVFTTAAILEAAREATLPAQREHVTPFLMANRERYEVRSLTCPLPGLAAYRWTLDTADDLAYLSRLCEALPGDGPPTLATILDTLRRHPALAAEGPGSQRNATYAGTAAAGEQGFEASHALHKRAHAAIPLAAQTFSKAAEQYPQGRAPLFLSHGQGGRVWDVDGNEYVDLVCGLLAVGLGYCDADVDAAIRAQMSRGISFSLPTRLEAELAERLIDLVPCAEAARFGKNGTDATSAAVRVARSYTARDRVVVCGYHGWQDWYIGATSRHFGVPEGTRSLTLSIPFDDLAAMIATFAEHGSDIAAVILEPMTFSEPSAGYLEGVQALCRQHGTVLVFDEMVTGFRFAAGGAQTLLGVTPDLACFGKAMGNGMPISALVGKTELMAELERVFYSGTFGGEALSLAAAIAVIDKMAREPVLETIHAQGQKLAAAAAEAVERHGLGDVITIKGGPAWTQCAIADHASARKEAIRTLYMREMIAAGVLTQGTHNICYAHSDNDIALAARAYDRAMATIAEALAAGDLEARLGNAVIEPVFRVRG